jgi:hypothetical protein
VKHYYNSTDFDGDDLAEQMRHELQHEERDDKSKHSSRRSYCGWKPTWLDMVAAIAGENISFVHILHVIHRVMTVPSNSIVFIDSLLGIFV